MRLTTIRLDSGTAAGRVDADRVTVVDGYADVGALLASGPDWRARAEAATGPVVHLGDADFAPLVLTPEKIVCVGLNYRDHCAEVGLDPPEHPTLFAKYHRALIGANDPIELPPTSAEVDWEAELGVVIGAEFRGPHVPDDAVAGYTIVNDVSMRDWQRRTSQFLQGKTFEGSTPVGPYLVTLDELATPDALEISCEVSGERMQHSNTRELVFSVRDILAYVSTFVTLRPGDLIATGTPGGVGALRQPPRYLTTGDVVVVTIEDLGAQRNPCRARVESVATT